MWDFSHVKADSLVSPLLRKRDFCSEHWIFYSRHVVSEEAHCLFFFLAESILLDPNRKYHSKAWFIMQDGQGCRGTLLAMGFCVGGGRNCPSGSRSSADLVWGHSGVSVWAPATAWVGTRLERRLMGSSSICLILSSFFLCTLAAVWRRGR